MSKPLLLLCFATLVLFVIACGPGAAAVKTPQNGPVPAATHPSTAEKPTLLTASAMPIPAVQAGTEGAKLETGSKKISSQDGMTLLYIPEGSFQMGSKDGSIDDEKPAHTVYLDAFWIDQTDVTNAMYARCVSAGTCKPPKLSTSITRKSYYDNAQYADYPVIYIDWTQADAYCKWAGRSLPSEAQWEKAARGADGRTYPWGEGIDKTKANYGENVGDTTKVNSYLDGASPYGALDMAGNVGQWLADWYDSTYYQNSPQNNPTGPTSGSSRVVRGGSWFTSVDSARSARRDGEDPSYSDNYLVGFRCSVRAAP